MEKSQAGQRTTQENSDAQYAFLEVNHRPHKIFDMGIPFFDDWWTLGQ
jgi:hypothetical protein